MKIDRPVLEVGILSGLVESLAMVMAVSKGFLIPLPGAFPTPEPSSVISQGGGIGSQPGNLLSFSIGVPGLLVALVVITLSFLAGYLVADLTDAAWSFLISQTTFVLVVSLVLLGFPSRISTLPENLQAFFFFSFVPYSLLSLVGLVFGAFVGDY